MMWRFLACIKLVLLFCATAAVAEDYSRSRMQVELPQQVLFDSRGRQAVVADILRSDQPVLLQFIFTTCAGICPVLAASFQAVQDDLAGQASLVSISIDPEYDTPAVLGAYASRFAARPHWQFYTGSKSAVDAVQKAFGVYQDNKMRHNPVTFLFANGNWLQLDGFPSKKQLLMELQQLSNS